MKTKVAVATAHAAIRSRLMHDIFRLRARNRNTGQHRDDVPGWRREYFGARVDVRRTPASYGRSRHRRKGARMIHAGDTIENPVTGERLVFKETSAETDGEYVRFECFVQPSGFVAAAHVHPFQEERFEVLEGSVTFRIDGQEITAEPGDRILVVAGRKH